MTSRIFRQRKLIDPFVQTFGAVRKLPVIASPALAAKIAAFGVGSGNPNRFS
ncbi:MAG: hypothetical protein AB3N19_08240 [Ruegeria sp.]